MTKKINISSEHKLTDLTSVGKTVNPLLKQLLGNSGMLFIELLNSWKEIIGEEIAMYCLPQSITFKKNERTDGCLHLMVLAGAFAMEVQQKQQHIIGKINTFFGYKAVNSIKITQNSNPENFLIKKKNIDNLKKNVVSEAEESYITKLIEGVENEDLRQALKNIGIAVLSRQKDQG